MNHQTDTPSTFLAMPGHTRLFRREGGTYYLRAKVPENLRPLIGKTEIRKSLRTKDLKEARQKVKIESVRADARFAAAQSRLNSNSANVSSLSAEEINWWTAKYFVEVERKSAHMIETEVNEISNFWERNERGREIAEGLAVDLAVITNSPDYQSNYPKRIVDDFLAKEGAHLNIVRDSETCDSLLSHLRRAVV